MQRTIPTKRFVLALIVLTAGFLLAFFTYFSFFLLPALASIIILDWETYNAPINRESFKYSRKKPDQNKNDISIIVISFLLVTIFLELENWPGEPWVNRISLLILWLWVLGVLIWRFLRSQRSETL